MTVNRVRCTQANRETAAEVLNRHYIAGSLDEAEMDERLGKALSARFADELLALVRDLPVLPPEKAPDKQSVGLSAQNVQNLAAIVIVFVATIMVINVPSWDMLSILLCCFVNGLIGFRRNGYLAAIGFISGLFLILGTCLMIFLTAVREKKVRAEKRGVPGYRDW